MTPEENDLLCRVEGDAPMGAIMRRHWIAACLSEEVAEPDGAPLRVKLLGENLVVFRDSKGRLGVLDEYLRAPPRLARLRAQRGMRAALPLSRLEVRLSKATWSRWPPSRPTASIPERVKQKAYPAREAGGFVWCYMGPADEMPEFEPPAFAPTPDARVSATKVRVRCNWAQILEGQIDSAHSSSLHSSDMVPAQVDGAKATDANWLRPSTDKAPRFQIERTSYGFRYAAIRRPIQNEATHDYIRTTVYIAPFTALIPPNNVHNVATLLTPEDDTHHDLLLHRLERAGQAGHRRGDVAQVQRAAMGRRRRCELQRRPHAREPLPAGSRRHEGRQLHRHPGHSQPGYRDVGRRWGRSAIARPSGSARATWRSRRSAA